MTGTFRENLIRILTQYNTARQEEFSGHSLARLIRHEFPSSLKDHFEESDRYLWKGSPGQGNWARAPWLAVFDILITNSAQSGYYPVYLFREDFSGVYLSLNQGVTEIRQKYQSEAKDALRAKAADYLAQIGSAPVGFTNDKIDLRPSSLQNLSAFYEAGNIFSKFYSADSIPENNDLIQDMKLMLSNYELLSYNETVPIGPGLEEEDEQRAQFIEDLRVFRQHKRIDRNARLAKEVKRIQGYTCKACGFNFEKVYGELGELYIEAHHLTPISELKGKRISLDPVKDFTVLCANCHRMIHRCDAPHDLDGFRDRYLEG